MVHGWQMNTSCQDWILRFLFYIFISALVQSKIDLSSSIEGLAKRLFDQIDTDSDSLISFSELQAWTTQEYNRTYEFQLSNQFETLDENNDTLLSWNEYLKRSYFLDSEGRLDVRHYTSHVADVKKSIANDKVRFDKAASVVVENADSSNSDGKIRRDKNVLDFYRFRMFSMPEFYPQMHSVIVETTLRNLDLNEDGVLSVDEYISAISRSRDQDSHSDTREDDSRREYEYFFSHRDENKDGLMDYDEVLNWVLPDTADLGVEEAGHLMSMFDKNEDGMIALENVLEEPEKFVRFAAPLLYLQSKKPPQTDDTNSADEDLVDEADDNLDNDGDDSSAQDFDFDPNSDHIEL